jgi:hypothetical protein
MLRLIGVTVVTAYARYLIASTLVILLQAECVLFSFYVCVTVRRNKCLCNKTNQMH